jgi:hypothetical protein
MSDNRRVYRRIKQGLLQLYPKQLTGNQARHLNTLTGMMTGIVQSKRCHFELMAAKAPDQSQVASRIKRFILRMMRLIKKLTLCPSSKS